MLMLLFYQPPIVLLHGREQTASDMSQMENWLKDNGFEVINCQIDDYTSKFLPIDKSAEKLGECIKNQKSTQNGFIGVGYEQGGLVMRFLLQMFDGFKMLRLITLGSPNAGAYCSTVSATCTPIAADVVYSLEQQKKRTLLTYWKDPHAIDLYSQQSIGLAIINNERQYDVKRKQRFLTLDRFVAIGDSEDKILQPAGSAFFNYYLKNGDAVNPYIATEIYLKDLFGLKTLNDSGRFIVIQKKYFTNIKLTTDTVFFSSELAPQLRMDIANPPETFGGLTKGAVIGISVGVVVVVLAILGGVIGYFVWRKFRK